MAGWLKTMDGLSDLVITYDYLQPRISEPRF